MSSLRQSAFCCLVHAVAMYALLARYVVAIGSWSGSGRGENIYNSRAMRTKSGAFFRMGGCCQICTTNFYRDLALLDVGESQEVAILKSFHNWKLAGAPTGRKGKPNLSAQPRTAKSSADCENRFNEHLAAFTEVREATLVKKQSMSGQRKRMRKVVLKSSRQSHVSKHRKGGKSSSKKQIPSPSQQPGGVIFGGVLLAAYGIPFLWCIFVPFKDL